MRRVQVPFAKKLGTADREKWNAPAATDRRYKWRRILLRRLSSALFARRSIAVLAESDGAALVIIALESGGRDVYWQSLYEEQNAIPGCRGNRILRGMMTRGSGFRP